MSKEVEALTEALFAAQAWQDELPTAKRVIEELAERGYAIVFQPEDGVQND